MNAVLKKLFNKRSLFLYWGSLALCYVLIKTDPSGGDAQTLYLLLATAVGILGLLFAHVARKFLFPYPESNVQVLLAKAIQQPVGAGLAVLGVLYFYANIAVAFINRVHL